MEKTLLDIVKINVNGNNFIFLHDCNYSKDYLSNLSVVLCDQSFGVGADQLVIIKSICLEYVIIDIYNPDGTQCVFCGNVFISVMEYYFDYFNILKNINNFKIRIKHINGIHRIIHSNDELFWLDIPSPSLLFHDIDKKNLDSLINSGTYHRVIYDIEINFNNINTKGLELSKTPYLNEETNVMFISNINGDKFNIFPWERGGTGSTLSCASGSAASAWILYKLSFLKSSIITVINPGGNILVKINQDKSLQIGAKPTINFRGSIFIDSIKIIE